MSVRSSTIGLLGGIMVMSATLVMTSDYNESQCRIRQHQIEHTNVWDARLSANGVKSLRERQMGIRSTAEVETQYLGSCNTSYSTVQVDNAILAGLITAFIGWIGFSLLERVLRL